VGIDSNKMVAEPRVKGHKAMSCNPTNISYAGKGISWVVVEVVLDCCSSTRQVPDCCMHGGLVNNLFSLNCLTTTFSWSEVKTMRKLASMTLSQSASEKKPAKMTEWRPPIRAHANRATTASGTYGHVDGNSVVFADSAHTQAPAS
jgi:hypothetical protein